MNPHLKVHVVATSEVANVFEAGLVPQGLPDQDLWRSAQIDGAKPH